MSKEMIDLWTVTDTTIEQKEDAKLVVSDTTEKSAIYVEHVTRYCDQSNSKCRHKWFVFGLMWYLYK